MKQRGRTWGKADWGLAVSGLLVGATSVWAILGERKIAALRATPSTFTTAVTGHGLDLPEIEIAGEENIPWAAPAGDQSKDDWAFDLFTPPVIFYNRATGQFSVTRPAPPKIEPVSNEVPFGVEVAAINPVRFRLQLVGYAEGGDAPLGIFQNEETGESVVARSGHRFEDLGLVLTTLAIGREDTLVPDSMPLREIVAVAGVWDEREERRVRLSSAGRRWTDTATVTLRGMETQAERTLKVGEEWSLDGVTYEVVAVSLDQAKAEIRKTGPDGIRETRALGPETVPPIPVDAETRFGVR